MMGHAWNGSDAGPRRRWRAVTWGGAAALLLTPLLAMQFTHEVRWTGSDFAAFGLLLALPLGALDLAMRRTENASYRAAAALALGAAALMTWVNLAVGIVGSEGNPLNLAFFGVLAVGVLGACIARFRPRGMARTLARMGIAQALIALAALIAGYPEGLLTGVFVVAWIVSARLFRRAAGERAVVGKAGMPPG
ncbi:hypothetical protein [Roseicella sp. DB1501]|uniref:hypothetical protein n=1 Tax=Roseicella sp. DB1501 TaxID=2730925 RepID=UPI001C2C0B5B|nr:hypothetical protein [Roseicella sp. DB1501]